jgi:hypothetical protein
VHLARRQSSLRETVLREAHHPRRRPRPITHSARTRYPIHHPPRAIAAELGPITIPAEPLDTSVAAEQKSAG